MIPIESYKAYVLYTTHLHGIYCVNAQYHCKTVYGKPIVQTSMGKLHWKSFTFEVTIVSTLQTII